VKEKNKEQIERAWNELVALLPEWATKNTHLRLLANQESVMDQAPGHELHIKTKRCTQCGDCCLETPKGHTPFDSDDEQKCNVLYKQDDKWLCDAGANKPFRCLADPMKANVPTCDIRYLK
jgi:hypothetical protein